MLLKTKVRAVGSSRGVIIPLPCLEQLGLSEGDFLLVDVQDNQLVMTKAQNETKYVLK